MRKQILTLTLLLTLALLPGSALRAQSIEVNGNADCEGWSANATLTFPDGVFTTPMDYSVVLNDQAGNELARFDWEGVVQRWEQPVVILLYEAPWDLTLDSVYTASFVFHFLGQESAMNLDVICGPGDDPEPEIEPCHHTYRYWLRHPDQWPVEELTVGGEAYSKDQLLRLLRSRWRFHFASSVARHLVAAQLNVLSGTDPSIQPTIDAAEALLVDYSQSGHHWWRFRAEARVLRKELVRYNRKRCDKEGPVAQPLDDLLEKAFADEPMSLGGMKAMYR